MGLWLIVTDGEQGDGKIFDTGSMEQADGGLHGSASGPDVV